MCWSCVSCAISWPERCLVFLCVEQCTDIGKFRSQYLNYRTVGIISKWSLACSIRIWLPAWWSTGLSSPQTPPPPPPIYCLDQGCQVTVIAATFLIDGLFKMLTGRENGRGLSKITLNSKWQNCTRSFQNWIAIKIVFMGKIVKSYLI
jgi:hypothetical protein